MANAEFCAAVHEICSRLFPEGFDVSVNPPNTFLDLALHVATTGRMVVKLGYTDDHEFDHAGTWQAFRAWHDWCHLHGRYRFTQAGECAAVRMQLAMITALYGHERRVEWLPIIHRQIIRDNFGDDAFCPALLPT